MVKNSDFNFENFAVSAIKSIDEIRSFENRGSTVPTESRINAFYRAIGLPTAITTNSMLDAMNNGNIFSATTLQYNSFSSLFINRRNSFKQEITQQEIDSFLLFNTSKISGSVRDIGDAEKRIRGTLFPLIVDGDIGIYPQEKRIAGAFLSDDELKVGTVVYKRPLIETIILMRLKGIGIQDTALQNQISDDFPFALNDLRQIAEIISESLNSTSENLGAILEDTVRKTSEAIKDTGINFTPIIANIAQQSLAKRIVPENLKGELDLQKSKQEDKLRIYQSVLSALEFDDTFLAGLKASRNVKDAMLASSLLSIISSGLSEDSRIKQDMEDTSRKVEKKTAEIKQSFKTMDLLLGTFSGISGIDILAVIQALFTIPIENIIGLLNDETIVRLKVLKGDSIANNRSSVAEAISNLEAEVISIFDKIDGIASRTKHADKQL